MSRKEIAGARFPQFHGARIRRNFVSISVLQRCPILDTGKRRGKGRERYLRWTNTHVYHRCTKCAVIWPCSQCAPAYLKCKYSDSPLYSRGSYCSITACPFFLSPPLPSITTVSDPMIFAFLWITFTMALRVHELFLILHGPDTAQKEKFISNNNSKWICGNYRGERTWNNFSFNVKACNNFRGNCSKIN